MFIFRKKSMDVDKPVPVVNISPLSFIGDPENQGRTVNIQGAWDPEISVAVINTVGVPVEKSLGDTGINSRKVVICIMYVSKASWVSSLR